MNTMYRLSIVVLLFLTLVSCGTTSTTNPLTPITPYPSSSNLDEPKRLPTYTPRPSSTPMPSKTPELTETAYAQSSISAQLAEQTLVAQYPHLCEEIYNPQEFSPNKLWIVEFCYSENDKSPILTLSNKNTQVLWKLVYGDFIENVEYGNGLGVVHWSPDQKYAYFASLPTVDGGECYIGANSQYFGKGLFRLDLQTGNVTTILPLQDNFRSYDFSFSPTGRRLIYQTSSSDLIILDIKTGMSINVKSVDKNQFGGGYLWSSDALEFVYSTVLDNEIDEPISYSLRLVDSLSGSQRILLESPDNCMVTKSWSDDNILTIESYDKNYDRTLIEFDLNSNSIITEATVTP